MNKHAWSVAVFALLGCAPDPSSDPVDAGSGDAPPAVHDDASSREDRTRVPHSRWELAAAAVVEDIVARAERTPTGTRWLVADYYDGTNVSLGYPVDFYMGAAGILYFLATYQRFFPTAELADLVRSGGMWLEEQVSEASYEGGLYVGLTGVGMAFLALHDVLPDEGWLERAQAIARRVPSGNPSYDIISGIAGEGLFFLELHDRDPREEWLVAARERGDQLLGGSSASASGDKWPVGPGIELYYSGLSHGTAGIGYFLARLGRVAEGDGTSYRDGAVRAAMWLASIEERRDGAIAWYRREPDQTGEYQTHWCHGPAGIGLFYLELWRLTRDEVALEKAELAGEAVTAEGAQWNPCVCHGSTGNAGVLLALAQETSNTSWQGQAEFLLESAWSERTLVDGFSRWESGDGTAAMNPSFMVGAAGIGYSFLQMAFPTELSFALTP